MVAKQGRREGGGELGQFPGVSWDPQAGAFSHIVFLQGVFFLSPPSACAPSLPQYFTAQSKGREGFGRPPQKMSVNLGTEASGEAWLPSQQAKTFLIPLSLPATLKVLLRNNQHSCGEKQLLSL